MRRLKKLAVLLYASILGGCGELGAPPPPPSPVTIVATRGLTAPRVRASTPAFVPANVLALGEGKTARQFELTIASASPAALALEVQRRDNGAVQRAVRAEIAAGAPLGADALAQLRRGTPLLQQLATNGVSATFRVAVPDVSRSPVTVVRVFDSSAADGAPLQSDQFELVDGFIYMAAVGDSVIWGNGLREADKFTARVAAEIERTRGRRVVLQQLAISAAEIEPAPDDGVCAFDCFGETPTALTSVTAQVGLIQAADEVEYLLLNGCLNDLGVGGVLDPETTLAAIDAVVPVFCDEKMQALLATARAAVPNATIVVIGYYPIVGPTSDLFGVEALGITEGILPTPDGGTLTATELRAFRDAMAERSLAFTEVSSASLANAVAARRAAGDAKVLFVAPPFGPENAIFTADKLLWSMTADNPRYAALPLEVDLFPEDDTQDIRLIRCFGASIRVNPVLCLFDSVGHPNPDGAALIADEILSALGETGAAPPRD